MNFHFATLLRIRGRHVEAMPHSYSSLANGGSGGILHVLLAATGPATGRILPSLRQELLSPGQDEDGRRDGTRLKASSQVLTRATRTTSVGRRLRACATALFVPSSARWSSSVHLPHRLRGCSSRRRAFVKMLWRARVSHARGSVNSGIQQFCGLQTRY